MEEITLEKNGDTFT